MKNLLIFLSLVISMFAYSQPNNVSNMTGITNGLVTQTLTNTTPDTAYIATTYEYDNVTIQAVAVKSTGTLTATERVEASVDGSNWVAIGDTATLTNETTHSYHWIVKGNPYKYYRVIILASTTNSSTFRCYFFSNGRKRNLITQTMKQATGAVSDTIVNTATGYVSIKVSNPYNSITIQAVCTKISGTVAGTVTLQGSNDGTNYNTVKTAYVKSNPITPFSTGGAATHTATDGTSTKIFVITGSPYQYYRLSWTGTGTMSGILKGYILANN